MRQEREYRLVEWVWDQDGIQYFLPGGRHAALQGSYSEVVEPLTSLGKEGWLVVGNTSSANWVFWTLMRSSEG